MPYCTQCGNQIAAGSRFCTSCGQPLEEAEVKPIVPDPPPIVAQPVIQQKVEPAPIYQQTEYDPPKRSNKGLIIGIFAIVVVGAMVGAYFMFLNKKSSAENYPKLYVLAENLKLRSSEY